MTVALNSGIDYTQWKALQSGLYATAPKAGADAAEYVMEQSSSSDVFEISAANETCTDGKDDGKIGFFSAVGNAVKGIGKTIGNGIKGMFTNKEGKFSLGKTLLTAATAAVCVLVPPVGVAACVVGGTMGAVQVGKGIYNAATAETDAEAKAAWQNVGGGAFTVASSVVGAKAGVKAVKNGAMKAGGSALDSLDDGASALQKLKAFGSDSIKSTKYNLSQAKTKVTTAADTLKTISQDVKAAKAETPVAQAKAALEAANKSGDKAAIAAAKEALKSAKLEQKAMAKEASSILKNTAKEAGKELVNNAKDKIKTTFTKDNAKHVIQTIKENANKEGIKTIAAKLSGKSKAIYNELISDSSNVAQLVQKYGFDNVMQVLQLFAGTELADQAI